MPKSSSLVLLALLAPLPLDAQAQVWVVDDDGGAGVHFTTIQAAVNAAADGDVVLVRSGSYAGVTVDAKELAVVADAGADARAQLCVVRDLAPSQTVELRGLFLTALRLENSLGPVWIEDVTVERPAVGGAGFGGAVDIIGCRDVGLQRCTISVLENPFSPGKHGVRIQTSEVHLYLTTATGGKGADFALFGSVGGAGLRVESGAVYLYGGAYVGGAGGAGAGMGPFGSCDPGSAGGPGLFLAAGAQLTRAGGFFLGGAGGPGGVDLWGGFVCANGPPGPPTSIDPTATVFPLNVLSQSYEIDSPVRGGQVATGRVDGVGAVEVFLLVSPEPAHEIFTSLLGAACVSPNGLIVLPVGTTDLNGDLALAFPMPFLGGGVEAIHLFTQTLYLKWGALTLGSGSALHVIDASL